MEQKIFMMKEEKGIETLFAEFDKTENELVQLVSSFDEVQINAIPFAGSWTAAQVTDHITKSNVGMIRSLKSEGYAVNREPAGRSQFLQEIFLNFEKKLQSPKFILPSQDIYNKDILIADLKQSIDQLKETKNTINLSDAINHPIFNEITKLEIYHFVVYHTQRHIQQLNNIFKALINISATPTRKIISFMHASLDGFVAGPNGEMNWITMDEEIFQDAIDLCAATDIAVYGRTTYEMMESYWPTVLKNPNASKNEIHHAEWVENISKIVFSTTLDRAAWNNTRLINKNVKEEVVKLKQEQGKNMMIFGSPRLTHGLMQMGLIDEYRININPVILGNGMPLFKNINDRVHLKLLKEKKFESGVIGLHYETKTN